MMPSRDTAALLVLCLAATSAGCSGIGDFDVSRDTSEVRVEGQIAPLSDALPINVIPALALDFDLQEELDRQSADGAQGVYLRDLMLRVTDTERPEGDSDDFDFIRRVSVYMSAPGLEEVKIAERDPVPRGVEEFGFFVVDRIDLKPYAEAGMTLTTTGVGSVPQDDVSMRARVTLTIEVF